MGLGPKPCCLSNLLIFSTLFALNYIPHCSSLTTGKRKLQLVAPL